MCWQCACLVATACVVVIIMILGPDDPGYMRSTPYICLQPIGASMKIHTILSKRRCQHACMHMLCSHHPAISQQYHTRVVPGSLLERLANGDQEHSKCTLQQLCSSHLQRPDVRQSWWDWHFRVLPPFPAHIALLPSSHFPGN